MLHGPLRLVWCSRLFWFSRCILCTRIGQFVSRSVKQIAELRMLLPSVTISTPQARKYQHRCYGVLGPSICHLRGGLSSSLTLIQLSPTTATTTTPRHPPTNQWTDTKVRATALRSMAQQLEDSACEFARAESMDCGKTLLESKSDIGFCVSILRYVETCPPPHTPSLQGLHSPFHL